MKQKRQTALNRSFNLFVITGALLLLGAYAMLSGDEMGWGIGMGIAGLLFLVPPAILMPYGYLFDSEGVSIRYLLLPQERYLWKNIYAIEVSDDAFVSSPKTAIYDLLFSGVFSVSGPVEGEARFYMQGHIRKSRRTKRLLERYWDGTITGYLWDDTKAWWNKRVRKKQKQIEQHLTDEIVPMERDARAKARPCIRSFAKQAAPLGLVCRTEYLYITKDLMQRKSRPAEGYTYTVLVEMSRRGETDADKIVRVSADLLYVRLGRTAYKGVENPYAVTELQGFLTDTLNEIQTNGIEAYCKARE